MNKKNRLLTLLLAATILVGVMTAAVPAFAADSSSVGLTVTNIGRAGVKVKYDISGAGAAVATTDGRALTPTEAFSYARTNKFFKYLADSNTMTDGTSSSFKYVASGIQIYTTRWVAFEIYVPTAGLYTLLDYYGTYSNAGIMNIYVTPADTAVNTSILTNGSLDEYKVGEVDLNNPSNTAATWPVSDTPKDVGDILISTPGYYKLVFRGMTAGKYFLASTIMLDGGDGAALIGSITPSASALTVGDAASVTASGYNSATATAATLSYESSDESVAVVNASTGAVTAVGAGTADILATADGITVPLKTSVAVSDAAATATADVLVTAANASNGGSAVSANITASGADSLVKGTRAAQNVGTRITVTADEEADGATFKYWQNHTTKKVVSSERSFEFTVGSNVVLVAVYSKAPEAGKYAVDFLNANGAVIQSTYVNSGATIGSIKPTAPTMTGYTFTGWNAEDAEVIDGDTYVMAEYEPVGITASINVNGTSNSYAFNAEVEATSDDADFSYWTRNGKIISYSPTYKFYAWKNAEVTAVCNGAVTKTPRVLLDGAPIGAAVMMEYEVPTGFTKVEAGIIYGGSNVTLANYTSKAISGSDAAHGQFTAVPNGGTSARAYLIYNNGTENKIVYSNIVWLT